MQTPVQTSGATLEELPNRDDSRRPGLRQRSLVDRASLPIRAEVTDERYGQPVETAAYFVVSEALANISKHAKARSAAISISRLNGRLLVEVRDDGRGGATAASGSGLQGLADRIGALDGRLTIESARHDPRGDPVRVVVADDSALIRDGLRHLLPAHGFEIAATAVDADELLEAVERTRPDVALVDIRMPPTHTTEGLAAVATIRERMPEVGVLILSQHVDADYALVLLHEHPTGCGYLLKERITDVETLVGAIQRVGRGESVVDRELVRLLLERPATRNRLDELSERERAVLALVAEGLTDRGIADRLWVTPKTVQTHVRHILAKLALPANSEHNRRVLAVLTYLRDGHG